MKHRTGTDTNDFHVDTTSISYADCSVLVSGSAGAGSVLSGKECFSRFVKFQLSNFAVGWVDWDLHLRAVLLGDDDFLDVDAPSSSVDGEDLSGLSFNSVLCTADLDHDSVSLPDWDSSAVVLGLEFFAEVAAHHSSSKTAWSGEVGLSRLSSLTRNT